MILDNPHEKEPDELVLNRLKSYFGQDASAAITVNRNEQDGYAIRIVPGGKVLVPRLTEADVIALLPAGSRWLPAVGWHSYFGVPFRFDGELWLALGVELVKRHHSRGAYILFVAFIFPFHRPPIRRLAELANELHMIKHEPASFNPAGSLSAPSVNILDRAQKFLVDRFAKLGLRSDRYRVVEADSRTPAEHVRVEAEIIREAVESYKKNELFLFRTLLLSKSELHPPPSLVSCRKKDQTLTRLQICYYKYLAATVPTIKVAYPIRQSTYKIGP